MKRIVILLFFGSVSFISSYGQWYYDKYNVTDIDSLSIEQFDEALDKTKNDLQTAGIFTLFGGLIIGGGFLTLYTGLPEDPTFIEELLGSEIMGKAYIVGGAGLAAAGVIWCLSDLGRIAQIKSARKQNYPVVGSLSLSPALIMNKYNLSPAYGIAVTVNF